MKLNFSYKIIPPMLLFLVTFSYAQQEKVIGPFRLFEKQLSFTCDSSQACALPDSFLIHQSEKIFLQDSLLSAKIDYQIDYLNGRITFLRNMAPGTKLKISYQIIPFQLSKTYFHRKIAFQVDSTQKVIPGVRIAAATTTPAPQSTLQKNGSIVRGISLGTNQGLKVESGLRMNISGKIADKVEVVAALTDQTTPIQPEGNTQTLNEIDKVFVQMKSEHFNATMGDYQLSFGGSEFAQYQRKLQGAMGTADYDRFDVTLSGAVSKGQYTSNNIQGLEGNQGPYQLRSESGAIDIIVLAGTEKVWIDGELMTRGENNDYIIEYSIGQITFTRKRLITADSRITVDFQYSDLKFKRNLYGLQTTSALWDDRVKIDLRLLHESDDKDNPLDFTLSEENIARLQTAGDNPDSAYISGVRYVGEKKGYYVQIDSLDIQFYRYVGADSGDYNLAFSYVGAGKGDYNSIGFGNYQYVGAGQGSYAPVIFLKPAQRHDLADISLQLKPLPDLTFSGEFASSRFDQNTYSGNDDADNIGLAAVTSFSYHPEKIVLRDINLGKFSLQGKYREVGSQFRYIDRSDDIEKNRKWDSENVTTVAEKIHELKMEYQPHNNIQFKLGYGDIAKDTYFNSNRWEAATDMALIKLPQFHYRIEQIDSKNDRLFKDNRWLRQSGSVDYQLWKLRPFFSYTGEHKQEVYQDTLTSGFKYDDLTSGLTLNNFKKLTTTFSFGKRDDWDYEQNQLILNSQALTYKSQWQYAGGQSFSATIDYIHRDKKFTAADQSDTRTDLGELQINHSLLNRAITANWNYQISNTQVAKKERVYFKVTAGEGNYRYNDQTDEYEPDDLGDYVLRIRQTAEFVPVVELRASVHLQFKAQALFPKKDLKNWRKWLSVIATDTYIRVEENTEEKDVWSIYRLDLSKFQRAGTTIYGNNTLRQDLYIYQNNRDFSVRLRYETKDQVNYQYIDQGTISKFDEFSMRIIRRLSNKFSAQIDRSQQSKVYRFTNRSNKTIEINDLSFDLSYRPRQVLEFALKSKLAFKKDIAIAPATKATEYSLAPQANYSFLGKGKLHLEFEWTAVAASPKDRVIPYELTGINRAGTTRRWSIGLNYNISRYVMATLNYNGRSEPDQPDTIHISRAEMRAYF